MKRKLRLETVHKTKKQKTLIVKNDTQEAEIFIVLVNRLLAWLLPIEQFIISFVCKRSYVMIKQHWLASPPQIQIYYDRPLFFINSDWSEDLILWLMTTFRTVFYRDVVAQLSAAGLLSWLKYAYEHQQYKWDDEVTGYAAFHGHLSCLKYAHENGCKLDPRICFFALNNNHFDCLIYAHQNGASFPDRWNLRETSFVNTLCEVIKNKKSIDGGSRGVSKKFILERLQECKFPSNIIVLMIEHLKYEGYLYKTIKGYVDILIDE